MKASIFGEVILLVGLLALAYMLYVQQQQLTMLELDVDRVRGAVIPAAAPPVPAAEDGAGYA